MHPAVHGLAAVAAAALLADLGHPDEHAALAPLAAALAGGLLPDFLERLVRRPLARDDASFVPDPANPAARALAEGVAAALREAWRTRRAITLRLHPLPRSGAFPALSLAFLPGAKAIRAELDPEPPAKRTFWTVQSRLPAFTADWPSRVPLSDGETVLLRFTPPAAPSAPVRCAFLIDGWPHGIPFALALPLAALPLAGTNVAAALAIGLATHLALDALTPRGIPWPAPFRRPRAQLGAGLLDERDAADALRVALPAALVAATVFLRRHAYLPLPHSWAAAVAAGALAFLFVPRLLSRRDAGSHKPGPAP